MVKLDDESDSANAFEHCEIERLEAALDRRNRDRGVKGVWHVAHREDMVKVGDKEDSADAIAGCF